MTALTLYGTTSLASTIGTASKLAITTGGTSTSKTTTAPNDSTQNFMEVLSQGGTGTDSASIGSPSGKGYLFDVTTLEGNTISSGNWSAVVRMNDTANFTAVTMILRAYVYNSGTYTAISTMTLASQSMSSTTTNYTFANTSFPAQAFNTGDKLYIDFWMHPITGHWTGDPIVSFASSSATTGIANQFQINTPGYVLSATQVDNDISVRGRLQGLINKDISTRGRIQKLVDKDISVRGNLAITKNITIRGLISKQINKDISVRGLINKQVQKDIVFRGNVATPFTVYGSNVAASTIGTADKLSSTTGGASASTTTNGLNDGTQNFMEVLSQGGTGTDSVSIGSPSGKGWLYDVTSLEGRTITGGNWTGVIRLNDTSNFTAVTFIVRAYSYNSGVYTAITTLTLTGQAMSSTSTNYTLPATLTSAKVFNTGDKLYIDLWIHPTTGTWAGDPIVNFVSNSGTAGVLNQFQINTPGTFLSSVATDKDVSVRGRIQKLVNKDIALRGLLQKLVNKDISFRAYVGLLAQKDISIRARIQKLISKDISIRGRIQKLVTKDISFRALLAPTVNKDISIRGRTALTVTKDIEIRGRIFKLVNKDIDIRGRISKLITKDISLRARLSGKRILSGGFAVYGNGTGTITYQKYRATQFPNPAMTLATVLPRAGQSTFAYNAILANNTTAGFDTSLDGVNWTDQTAQNGQSIAGIFSQTNPTVDQFSSNTSANYTSTFRTGGSVATAAFDTAKSRVILNGGTNALYVNSTLSDNDVDFFADFDTSDNGGLVWRMVDQSNFYYLEVHDSLSSTGTPNVAILSKVSSNSRTQLAIANTSYTLSTGISALQVNFTRGTFRRFRVTMLLGVITVYMDGQILISYTDNSPLGIGKVGFYTNGGTLQSYQLWILQIGDYVTGTPSGDIVTSEFVYTRQRLQTIDPSVTPEIENVTTLVFNPQIQSGALIPTVTYTAQIAGKIIDDLAKQSNFGWFIDAQQNINFRTAISNPSPWILQSNSAGLVTSNDLEITTNFELDVQNDLYRNRQIILGALDSSSFVETQIGDGSTQSFTLSYPVASLPTIVVNGVVKTVGIKGDSGFDFYYALNDPIIAQDANAVPIDEGVVLSFSYTGFFSVVVQVDSVPAQMAQQAIEQATGFPSTGIVEDIEDHSGDIPPMTKDQAESLAQQLLSRYAIDGRQLIFDTTRDGLDLGQTLSIFLPEHGIWDGQFQILEIECYLKTNINQTVTYTYKVTCSELPKSASWAKLLASGLLFN